MKRPNPLLIVGASGRAAAASMRRKGYDPFVIDLFSDSDTRRLAPCLRCPFERYPDGFIELARQAPEGPWMYTGALENYPDVIEEISVHRPLIGNGLAVIAEVRDPWRLAQHLPEHVPACSETVPAHGSWILKPKAGAAGIGIRRANPGDTMPPGCFAQEYLEGPSYSALFFDEKLLGVTQQLIGTRWLNAPEFRYAGNVGPLPGHPLDLLQAMGRNLVHRTGLRADWGFDFMISATGKPLVIEVNPRYTAARELFDYAAIRRHHAVFAKGIFYAPRRFTLPADGPWSLPHGDDLVTHPDWADIPDSLTVHEQGQPVITMLVEGANAEDCLEQLRLRTERLNAEVMTRAATL
jgi:predicted ATP-grasp superfamily ATP-dependent carboligase